MSVTHKWMVSTKKSHMLKRVVSPASLFQYVWPFSVHEALKGERNNHSIQQVNVINVVNVHNKKITLQEITEASETKILVEIEVNMACHCFNTLKINKEMFSNYPLS